MDLNKLVYEVKEFVGAMSDDRYLDDRYVTHLINVNRADILKKDTNRKPGKTMGEVNQTISVDLSPVSSAIRDGVALSCKVVRSTNPLPRLVYSSSIFQFLKVRPAGMRFAPIEYVEWQRVPYLTFEFPVIYAAIDVDYYLYLFSPNNDEDIKYAAITGVFDEPTVADATILDDTNPTAYPMPNSLWTAVKPQVVNQILQQVPGDPLNNEEPDVQQTRKPQSRAK